VRKIIRSTCYVDPTEKTAAKENLGRTRIERLLNHSKAETAVLSHVLDFYAKTSEAPSLQSVFDHFEALNSAPEVTLIEEATAEKLYDGASYKKLFEDEVETQAAELFTATCKEAIKIATQGTTTKGITSKGTTAAIAHIFSAARTPPEEEGKRFQASMKNNNQALDDLYQERKTNPQQTYGVMTGYGIFDQATAGIRKKQLYIHAGFGGHLKSTTMFNIMVNAATAGWNPLLFTSEMPAPDVQLMMIAIHSADPKFNGAGRPLNAFRLLLGALRPEEEAFFKTVKDDLLNNPNHGLIRVIDSSDFTTFGSIMQRTVREDAETEVDQLWVDYLTRLPVDTKYHNLSLTEGRNETIAESKRFSMSFRNGEGLAVCTPFQINREGYKAGIAASGRLTKTALAQYNAAEKEADIITYVFYDKDEEATSEPKLGVMKTRWGRQPSDPVSVFIEPDSRRMIDMSAGMGPQTGYAPTAGGKQTEDEVTL
jgi:hypothetical protein